MHSVRRQGVTNGPTRRIFTGLFPLYRIRVEIPRLGFSRGISVIGVPTPPTSLDGIACFRFLNRFTYGNFGNAGEFGLEL